MLEKLRAHPDALYFLEPVDGTIVPDYRIKIKNPIDLRTMQTKGYTNISEFEADMKLLFSKCKTYNTKHSQGDMRDASLEKLFKKEWGRETS
ncbi:transcription factor, partial [Cladochytrium replicatum]